jgi:hypothetical protein
MSRIGATFILFSLFFCQPASAEIFSWADDQGIQYYTTDPANIPERYRAQARSLSLPPSPAPPADLQPVAPPKGKTKISYPPGSSILVRAKINGAGPITLILDTGADRTLITSAGVSNLGLSTENSMPVLLSGVTGASRGSAIWVDSIEIEEAKAGPLLITIYDAVLKEANGLLGRDFLAHFNVTIDSKEGVVTLESHNK